MAESQLMDFHERVARYERSRNQGDGFEADGTQGRSRHSRRKRRKPVIYITGLAFVLFTLLALKAGIILFVGEGVYAERLERMNNGEDLDRLGAAILRTDPISSFMVDQARTWMPLIPDLPLGK